MTRTLTPKAMDFYLDWLDGHLDNEMDREWWSDNHCSMNSEGEWDYIEPSTEIEEFDEAYNRECNIADIEWKERGLDL